ncbi:MAG: hypothetical protein R3E91_05955 [Chlamydiales bacterium]
MQEREMSFEEALFPWGDLPYPCEYAKRGFDLAQRGEIEKAKKMTRFYQATLDHYDRPIYSFFQQEKGGRFQELERASHAFLKACDVQPLSQYHFIDSQLGILYHRQEEQTILCLGSGCKSGMGAFFVGKVGVVNFGPQLKPLGDCSGFGLAGKGRNIEISENLLSYQCRLAAPHHRDTGISWLKDSGYCGAWIESRCAIDDNCLDITSRIEGFRPLSDFIFTYFMKAQTCYVAGSHKLTAHSLDRYQGPPQPIKIDGLVVNPCEGFCNMEVIPLAGDNSFWEADFMISFKILRKNFHFTINTYKNLSLK